jgi:hypothetical protein
MLALSMLEAVSVASSATCMCFKRFSFPLATFSKHTAADLGIPEGGFLVAMAKMHLRKSNK